MAVPSQRIGSRRPRIPDRGLREFDAIALFAALDAQRVARGLSWRGVADEIWEMSSELNRRRSSHPISPATLTGVARSGRTSCQHALFMLRWLGRSPESFLGEGRSGPEAPLPNAGPDRRLRWDLVLLYEGLDQQRRARQMTWKQLAQELGCTSSQLTGLRTARFATGVRTAMRITQWLGRPAADFIYAARW